jgi:porin
MVLPVGHVRAQSALTFDFAYTAEVWTSPVGASSRDARYLDKLDVTLTADMQEAAGWRGATLFLYGLYNNGASISQLTGDAQFISNLETGFPGGAARLYEAWLQQQVGKFSFKAGFLDLNAEFDVLESADVFLNAAHGIGSALGLSGRNGPSIFPIAGLGLRAFYQVSDGLSVRLAVTEGVPGNVDRPRRTSLSLKDGDGALVIAEADMAIPGGKVLLGHWRYTAQFEGFDGGTGRGNNGYYIRAQRQLLGAPTTGGHRLNGFVRFGIADGNTNAYNGFIGAGLVYSGVDGRPDDQLGIAFATSFASDAFAQSSGAQGAETSIELTYRWQLTQHLALQPDVQYIFNPSADPTLSNVLALGLRAKIGFSF